MAARESLCGQSRVRLPLRLSGASCMAYYRVYYRDGSGNFVAAESIEAEIDEEAVRIARELEHGVVCEVWERDRFVAKIQPLGG